MKEILVTKKKEIFVAIVGIIVFSIAIAGLLVVSDLNKNDHAQIVDSSTEGNLIKEDKEQNEALAEVNSNENSDTNNKEDKIVAENETDKVDGSTSNRNKHSHEWEEVYKEVNHNEEGHYEKVVVKKAWTEKIPVYNEVERYICNGCGKDITEDAKGHIKNQKLAGNTKCTAWHTKSKKVETGTNTIKHPEETENKWVVDKKAWTEKVVSGYKCKSCGTLK